MAKFCARCGNPINADDVFCSECGNVITQTEYNNQTTAHRKTSHVKTKQKRRKKRQRRFALIIITVAIISIVACTLAIILKKHKEQPIANTPHPVTHTVSNQQEVPASGQITEETANTEIIQSKDNILMTQMGYYSNEYYDCIILYYIDSNKILFEANVNNALFGGVATINGDKANFSLNGLSRYGSGMNEFVKGVFSYQDNTLQMNIEDSSLSFDKTSYNFNFSKAYQNVDDYFSPDAIKLFLARSLSNSTQDYQYLGLASSGDFSSALEIPGDTAYCEYSLFRVLQDNGSHYYALTYGENATYDIFEINLNEEKGVLTYFYNVKDPKTPEEENVCDNSININLSIIDSQLDAFLQNAQLNGSYYVSNWDNNFFNDGIEVYGLALDGTEENYYLYDEYVTITARNNAIVAYSQDAIQASNIKNIYQLLNWMGGEYVALLDYEPEAIQYQSGGLVYFKWETNNAVFVVATLGWSGSTEWTWQSSTPRAFCIYKK